MSSISHSFELTWRTASVPSNRLPRPLSTFLRCRKIQTSSFNRLERASFSLAMAMFVLLAFCRTFPCRFEWRYEATPAIDTIPISYRYVEGKDLDEAPRSPGRGSKGNGPPINPSFSSNQRVGSERGSCVRSHSGDRSLYGLWTVLSRSSKGG